MDRFFWSSLGQSLSLILAITLLTFTLLYCGTGDPLTALRNNADEHIGVGQEKVLKVQYGLDKPYWQQYLSWLGKFLQGDWGLSYLEGRPVAKVIGERVPATCLLTFLAFPLGLLLALILGITAALWPDSWLDKIICLSNSFILSTPAFLLSLLLLQIFSLQLGWLPTGGMSPLGTAFNWSSSWLYLIMPVGVLAYYYANGLLGLIRKAMLNTVGQPYIRTARAGGLSFYRIVFIYALKNALLPVITLVAMSLPRFFTGAFVVEYIFSWPGMGRLIVESAFQRDYPVLMAVVVIISILVVLSNFLAQFLYRYADPRIRVSETYEGKEDYAH